MGQPGRLAKSCILAIVFLVKSCNFTHGSLAKSRKCIIIRESNIKDTVKEGKAAFRQVKKDGSINRAKNAKKCPKCGAEVKDGQRFFSNTLLNLKMT